MRWIPGSGRTDRALGLGGLVPYPGQWSPVGGVQPGEWVSIVYACLRLISKRVSSMPLRVVDRDGRELPVPLWLRRPNEWVDHRLLMEQAAYALLMQGHWTLIPRRDRSGRMAGLVVPDPARVAVRQVEQIVGGRSAFELVIDGRPWHSEHWYAPWMTMTGHPQGLSAISAARLDASISKRSTEYVDRFLTHGVVNQFILQTKETDRSRLNDINAMFSQAYSGAEASFLPMTVPGDIAVHPISMPLKDAQLLETARMSDARICAVFGIDPTILGIMESGSQLVYTSVKAREQLLYSDALEPVVKIIESALTKFLPDGQRVDLDQRRYMQRFVTDKTEMGFKMSQMIVEGKHLFHPDEIRESMGYPPRDDLPDAVGVAMPQGQRPVDGDDDG